MSEKKNVLRKKILRHLYFTGTLSCAQLSRKLNKSLPLTTSLLNELISEGYVLETGYAPSSGGRRPAMYSVRPDVLYLVAVAMDQFVTRIVILDLHNQKVSEEERFDLTLPQNPQALSQLIEMIDQVIDGSGIPKEKFAGIGIGMPGFVDVQKGINYSFLPVGDKSITRTIEEQTGLPVFIDNDSSVIALAELRFGAARDLHNAMVINAGWGIGLGLVLNGELFRGENGFAGEFSHIPLFLNGKLCSCGKAGCLETESSLLVIIEKARKGLQEGRVSLLKSLPSDNIELAIENIFEAAQRGDRFAVELLSEVGYNLGRGVAVLIHLLNPQVIVMSGRGALAGKLWQAPIQQALNEHCIPRLAANTSIAISTLGYSTELIGAAALVMENYGRDMEDKARNLKKKAVSA